MRALEGVCIDMIENRSVSWHCAKRAVAVCTAAIALIVVGLTSHTWSCRREATTPYTVSLCFHRLAISKDEPRTVHVAQISKRSVDQLAVARLVRSDASSEQAQGIRVPRFLTHGTTVRVVCDVGLLAQRLLNLLASYYGCYLRAAACSCAFLRCGGPVNDKHRMTCSLTQC